MGSARSRLHSIKVYRVHDIVHLHDTQIYTLNPFLLLTRKASLDSETYCETISDKRSVRVRRDAVLRPHLRLRNDQTTRGTRHTTAATDNQEDVQLPRSRIETECTARVVHGCSDAPFLSHSVRYDSDHLQAALLLSFTHYTTYRPRQTRRISITTLRQQSRLFTQ